MQSLTQPSILLKPFAEDGQRNSIPLENTDTANPQLADLTNGFPAITSEDPDDDGLPPERKDFNALGYLTTLYDFFYQAGGTFTFNADISTAIGGYPLNARLWYTDGNGASTILRSTIGNNTDNFNTTPSVIGTSWVAETPVLSWNNVWTGDNTFSGDNTFTGDNAFPTQTYSDNSTKVATTAFCRSLLSNIARGNFSEKVELISSSVTSGNITLSQAYTDFDGLIVVSSNDNDSQVETQFISTFELNERRSYGNTWVLVGGAGEKYWICTSASTTTSFVVNNQNCAIQMIYGVNF